MRYRAFLLFTFITISTYAQDQLFKKDNTKIDAKILEINPTEIKYKLFTYQEGPTITIAKSDVVLIIYQNGTHEAITTPTPQVQQPQALIVYREENPRKRNAQHRNQIDSVKLANFYELTKTKNLISLNLISPLNGNIGISYLRELADGFLHIYVPIEIGVAEPTFNQPSNIIFGNSYNQNNISNYKYDRKTIEGGIGFHIQTSGKRAITHFVGPYIGIAQFSGSFKSYDYDPNNPYTNYNNQYNYTNHNFIMNRYTFMLNNGILFRLHKNFNMMLIAGIGYHTDDYISNNPKNYMYNSNYYYTTFGDFPINTIRLGMNVGYRF